MKLRLRSLMFRAWYWYINRVDVDADILFMNYGYADSTDKVILDHHDEPNRYSIQLYHRLANAVSLKDRSIVEIGCGRGGGLAYIAKRFSPSSSLGIDLESRAVHFANKHHNIEGLSFTQGNAQNLPIESSAYDVVLNVESSHRYLDMKLFLSEVSRVLKPDGYFLFTDFRASHELPALQEALNSFDLTLVEEQKINARVVAALSHDTERRKRLVEKLVPRLLHKTALDFAGVEGSETYHRISSGEYPYFLFIFQKWSDKESQIT